MGAKLGGGNKRGRRRGGGVVSDINVTPLVDVMLVLLVIFMITAPMLTAGFPVDLPKASAKPLQQTDNSPLEISVMNGGKIYMGETEVTIDRLKGILQAISLEGADRRVYIKADSRLPYGTVMGVMGAVSSSGFTKIALITDPREIVQ